jgi:hypothetical protein
MAGILLGLCGWMTYKRNLEVEDLQVVAVIRIEEGMLTIKVWGYIVGKVGIKVDEIVIKIGEIIVDIVVNLEVGTGTVEGVDIIKTRGILGLAHIGDDV